jgi:spermidine dehydrogenase
MTRKDFLNAALLGVGAALLRAPAPLDAMVHGPPDEWTGPGGVGDYATSNGNTKAVMDAAHRIRDGAYGARDARGAGPRAAGPRAAGPRAADTGERYDLVVVGGGITGLTAAYFFAQRTGAARRCLVLDNHPIFGGEAKQNELVINGVRLMAPQGSNDFGVPREGSGWQSDLWDELRMPREFAWADSGSKAGMSLRMAQDNYQPMEGIGEYGTDIGYFFDAASSIAPTPRPTWLRNIWQNDLAELPVSDDVRRDLLRWRTTNPDMKGMTGDQFARHLDTLSYRDYLENVLGFRAEVTRMIEPVIGLISGASPDAVSAHAAQQIGMPGVSRVRGRNSGPGLSFPGGNVTYGRHLVKKLIPDAIAGPLSFDAVLTGRVQWRTLDRRDQPTRIRVGTTVVRVEHVSDGVRVTYARDGALHSVHARRVVMATGGWVNKRVLADIPAEMKDAYSQFVYAPALIINVGLTNWRFMHRLGITAARWFDDRGVGFVANLRRQMTTPEYRPSVDPDQPNILTFYLGLYTPGRPAAEQGTIGRTTLLAKSYAEYERSVLGQLTHQFSDAGFSAKRDVAGVILNRWGHARLVQPPGWYFGVGGRPAPRDVVANGYGSIGIGHSELNGHQSAAGAMAQGKRVGEWAALG